MDDEAKRYFQVDSSTGTIKLLRKLDYETKEFFKFDVMVSISDLINLFYYTLKIFNALCRLMIWETRNYIPIL